MLRAQAGEPIAIDLGEGPLGVGRAVFQRIQVVQRRPTNARLR